MFAGNSDVTGQRKFRRTSHEFAVDRRDGDLGQSLKGIEDTIGVHNVVKNLVLGHAGTDFCIHEPGGKPVIASARYDDGVNVIAFAQGLDNLTQFQKRTRVQSIEGIGTIDPDGGDWRGKFQANVGAGSHIDFVSDFCI